MRRKGYDSYDDDSSNGDGGNYKHSRLHSRLYEDDPWSMEDDPRPEMKHSKSKRDISDDSITTRGPFRVSIQDSNINKTFNQAEIESIIDTRGEIITDILVSLHVPFESPTYIYFRIWHLRYRTNYHTGH